MNFLTESKNHDENPDLSFFFFFFQITIFTVLLETQQFRKKIDATSQVQNIEKDIKQIKNVKYPNSKVYLNNSGFSSFARQQFFLPLLTFSLSAFPDFFSAFSLSNTPKTCQQISWRWNKIKTNRKKREFSTWTLNSSRILKTLTAWTKN